MTFSRGIFFSTILNTFTVSVGPQMIVFISVSRRMWRMASAPRVSYVGTRASVYALQACSAITHSKRFLENIPIGLTYPSLLYHVSNSIRLSNQILVEKTRSKVLNTFPKPFIGEPRVIPRISCLILKMRETTMYRRLDAIHSKARLQIFSFHAGMLHI